MSLRALYEVPAPAKLNLFLHVVGRRADGYHLLQSVFVLIDWADTLHFERRDDGHVTRHDLGAALPTDDLCLRAARALRERAGVPFGADISIEKRVPWGAGLGGGSSDAATTLLALNRLWGLNWSRQQLLALAISLGADVPFFVGGCNAWVEGIGERLSPIALDPLWLAVLKPAAAIPTAAIFNSALLVRDTEPVIVSDFLASHLAPNREGRESRESACHVNTGNQGRGNELFGRNDLQVPAQAHCREVTQALSLLDAAFGNSRMTGSGSAVFAQAGSGATPRAAMVDAQALPAGWVGRMCRSLAAHPLRDWVSD